MYNKFFSETTNQKRVREFPISYLLDGHVGGCYSPYNNKIYFAPYRATFVTEFDPVTKSTTRLFFDTNIVTHLGTIPQYAQGAVYAPNNKIYFIPFSSTKLIVYNLITQSFEYISSSYLEIINESKFNGGIIANDGKLYLIPYSADRVGIVDISTDTISYFGNFASLTHLGGVYAENNKIFQAPISGVSFREIDLLTNTISTFGNLGTGSFRWLNGCNGLDGNLYFPPLLANTVLKLNPFTKTFSQISISGLSGSSYYGNLQLAPNGNLYGFSFDATRFLEVIPSKNLARSFYVNGSNRYHGNIYCEQGAVGVPRNTSLIKIIENIGIHNSQMITFPTDVSTISTSVWNKYQQTL
jgi:hypothetical protein